MPHPSNAVPPILAWFSIGVALAFLIALGAWPKSTLGPLLDWLIRPDLTFRLALLWLIVAGVYLATLAVHEAGHVAGGLLGGFTFRWIRASLLTLDRSGRLSFSSDWNRFATGETKMDPPAASDARWRYAAFAAGGPVANILAGLLVLAVTGKAGIFVVVTLLFGIAELLPLENRLGISDGMRLRMLFFQRPRGTAGSPSAASAPSPPTAHFPTNCPPSSSPPPSPSATPRETP